MLIRLPHVAGTFYPADPAELKRFCETHLKPSPSLSKAKAVLLPHAGYFYSGITAASVLRRVRVPNTAFLIGPNHMARGAEFALAVKGEWATPLGSVPVAREDAEELLRSAKEVREDDSAHAMEHSLEVEVPMLLFRNPFIQIIPMVVGTLDLAAARRAALECANFLSRLNEPPLVVISSDFNHYESDAETRTKDRYALNAIKNLDADALVKAVRENRITMCGFLPVYMLLLMKEALQITKATLVDYRTSADASGEKDRVVGYAGFIFE